MNIQYPDFFARFYDLIYDQVRSGTDKDFFLNEVSNAKGKVLEIGVGTGRFFKDALKSNADIYGIDISQSMINVLKSKVTEQEHYRISNQNIIDFSFDFKFDLIIAPFRVMMHLIDKEEQIRALNNVFHHLAAGGRFIFDAFVPDLKQLIKGHDNQMDFEGEYEEGKKFRRFVTTKPDLIKQLIHVTFRLEWEEGESMKIQTWDTSIRFYFRFELEHLVERSAFTKHKIFGDYQGNKLNADSREFVVECIL